jgi:hypothetical protein
MKRRVVFHVGWVFHFHDEEISHDGMLVMVMKVVFLKYVLRFVQNLNIFFKYSLL